MGCRFCKSTDVRAFTAEMNIRFPGRENLDKPTVMIFSACDHLLTLRLRRFRGT